MTDLVGYQLGTYRLTRLLGKGGFADVYLGEHVHLNTLAAIKVLQTRLEGNDIEQFRNEARMIARLKHPNIISTLDFNVQGDIPFLVMDYAVNGTLRQYYTQRLPMKPTVAIPYVRQAASALQYAHDQHLMHRDVKPENMLLGANNEVLLSDFGLALIMQSTVARSSANVVDTAGTIYYMAPEQIQGHPNAASDQYALAVVVYEWLTGTRPFKGTTYTEIAMQHISTPPAPLREKIPTIPREVEDVIQRALAKNPQQRFPNVMAFANAFEQACKITPLATSATGTQSSTVRKASGGMQSMEAALQSSSGRFPLGTNVVAIGRASSNQLVLNDPKVSGRHALIQPDGQGYSVIDIGSANGTFVNHQRILPNTPRTLNQGDAITIGDNSLTFEMRASGTMMPLQFSQGPTERASMPLPPSQGPTEQMGVLPAQGSQYGFPMPMPAQPSAPMPIYYPPQEAGSYPPPFNAGANPQPTGPIQPSNNANGFNYQPTGPINPYAPPPPPSQLLPSHPPRRRLWIVLSILVILLIVGIGGGVFAFVNGQSTPAKTLDAFCTALPKGDYTTAYNQFASSYQNVVTRADFEGFYGKANACTHANPTINGNTAQASWTLSIAGHNTTIQGDLNQDSSSIWKITDDTQLFGTAKALRDYCTALKGGDQATAYGQFSNALQQSLPQDVFKNSFPKVTSCSYAGIALAAKGTAAILMTASSAGQNQTSTVMMAQDTSSNWKIDDFASLPAKTMTAFCTALQQKDDHTAYTQFSSTLQNSISESQFTDLFKVFTSCNSSGITLANGHVTAIATLGTSSGQTAPFTTYLVSDNTGTWRIDDLFNPPDRPVLNFCDALNQRNYQTAYDQFSSGWQSSHSESSFQNAFSSVTNCTNTFPQQNGTAATSQVTLTLSNGQTAVGTANLIELGDGTWRIDSLV